jgi:hypothetical protein
MTRKLKPIDILVEEHIAKGVLDLPVMDPEGALTTVGKTVKLAAQLLQSANGALADNPLCEVAAQFLMKELKRRGNPSFVVDADCNVLLHIEYAQDTKAETNPSEPLPSLEALRERAGLLGVDITDLGRQKRAILERLEQQVR